MNKWEREEFLPKLAKKPMSENEYLKIAREYDYKHHDKTRETMNSIHDAVKTINKISKLVKNSEVQLQIQCPTKYKLSGKWLRAEFFKELKTGPMTQERFDYIMKNSGTDNTRKYYKEWDTQRSVANAIWNKAACAKDNKVSKKTNDDAVA
jgi:hypothetical protein